MNIIEKRATNPAVQLDGTELVYLGQGGADAVATVSELSVFNNLKSFDLDCGDELTPLTTGTKRTWRIPYEARCIGFLMSLTTAQTSGSVFTVDIQMDGVSVFITKLTIDNNEKTSATASTPCGFIAPLYLTYNAEMTLIITQIGNGTATGLKASLLHYSLE